LREGRYQGVEADRERRLQKDCSIKERAIACEGLRPAPRETDRKITASLDGMR